MATADRRTQILSIAVVLLVTALGGLALWKSGGANREFLTNQRETALQKREAAGLSDEQVEQLLAWAEDYVHAVQRRDCEQVIAMTAWMQDRLDYVRARASDAVAEEQAAREDLCQKIHRVPPDRSELSEGGVDDAALFTPLAEVELVSVDPGADDLEAPSAGRVWLRVRYPGPNDALRDASGRSIKTIRAGLTLSPEGRVIKAGIVGNVEIDTESEPVYW